MDAMNMFVCGLLEDMQEDSATREGGFSVE